MDLCLIASVAFLDFKSRERQDDSGGARQGVRGVFMNLGATKECILDWRLYAGEWK